MPSAVVSGGDASAHTLTRILTHSSYPDSGDAASEGQGVDPRAQGYLGKHLAGEAVEYDTVFSFYGNKTSYVPVC